MKEYLRLLPPVHEMQKDSRFGAILGEFNLTEEQLTKFVRQEVEELREQLLTGQSALPLPDVDFPAFIFGEVKKRTEKWAESRLKRVINGTGTVLHTNLGRARLSEKAVEHVADVARNYSNLEYKTAEGIRGSRHDIIEDLVKEVTGAESAMVVNNNAAAVFLVLRALAKDKEVIVSRGQLVEIGGSFRISSIMEESGAKLVEVGTTNKTHLYDYENALTEETALILKVHTSNFKTIGFTESVDTEALAGLKAGNKGVLFYEDLGSGALFDFGRYGIGEEPLVRQVLESGVDVVSFSGDKLLGGPQAGVIAGRKEVIDRLKKHQLARVLRVDKMTLAALEVTLKTYLSGEQAINELPTVRDIVRPADAIKAQAERFAEELLAKTDIYDVRLLSSTSQIGGGTMPGVEIPTVTAAVTHEKLPAQELARQLRSMAPVIVTLIRDDRVCIDFRTIDESEMPDLLNGFIAVGKN